MVAEPEPQWKWSDASNRDSYDDDYGYEQDSYATAPPPDAPRSQLVPALETQPEPEAAPKLDLGQLPQPEPQSGYEDGNG